MTEQKRPLQPGDPVPAFTLPAANREGTVSLDDLRGRPFLIGFFRGLHCPFCRRQVVQLGSVQPALRAAGVETIAVVNTPVERARLYDRHRPTTVTLLADPDCATHRAFGVPHIEFLPEGSSEHPQWPLRASLPEFMAARINPTGELDEPLQPIETNPVLNAREGFEMEEADHAILAKHMAQLVGHFLVDAQGKVAWVQIEAPDGPNSIGTFPTPAELIAAANGLRH
jgi:peroxiredoxin